MASGGEDVQLSKTLSWVLRHGAGQVNVTLDEQGFVPVQELLRLPQLRRVTLDDVQRVVHNNSKQRFALQQDDQRGLLIRANQGHTIAVAQLHLTPITDSSAYPTVVHGTFMKNWHQIKEQGLKRFQRNHIHFASGLPGTNGIISGMRAACDVLIFVDLENAISDGFQFFLSANGVILCPGNDEGVLPPKYFKRVTFR